MRRSLLFFLFTITVTFSLEKGPTVKIPLGVIEGFEKQTVDGKRFFAFEGVPYARPPVGEHRFKDPLSAKPWTGIWKANTVFKCIQYFHFSPPVEDMVIGNEDCLYVNIYTPKPIPQKKVNVLVYIHGGAFMFNNGHSYGPEMILERNIVYVNLNYRLGPLGFLSTEDYIVPGNMGLKDQQMALEWIKNNIEHFGGDPNSITISGMSSGAASVEYHYLSQKSMGLFRRGISLSGSALNSWTLIENGLEKTEQLARVVGCPLEGKKKIVDCLREKPAKQLVQAVQHFQPWLYNPFAPFGPVIDSWSDHPFLPDHPYQLLKNKKVADLPWIISYVSSEGLYPGAEFYSDKHLDYIDKHWNEVMPHILMYNDTVDPQNLIEVSQMIRKEYTGTETISKKTFSKLIQALSDRIFLTDMELAGKLHSAAVKSPVYSYYFDYRGAHSASESRSGTADNIGVSHADDTFYVLRTKVDALSTESDRKMSRLMTDIFISFMESGVPDVGTNWEPLSKKVSDPWVQLTIRSPNTLILEGKDDIGNRKFWNSLPLKENEKLFKLKEEL